MASDQQKRKRTHWNNNVKQKSVEAGVSGLLFTCDREREALHEAYCIIDELLDDPAKALSLKATVPDKIPEEAKEGNNDDSEEDIADSLKKACDDEQQARKPPHKGGKERRCKQRPTGVKNVLFVSVKDSDASLLAEEMVNLAQNTPRCRHLQRVLPVEYTAEVDLKKLSDYISQSVVKYIKRKEDNNWPTYSLEFKARNNSSVTKANVLEMLDDAMHAMAPGAKADLSHAEVTFFVQLVRTTMMVGVCRDFYKRRKYSMRPNEETEKAKVVEEPKD